MRNCLICDDHGLVREAMAGMIRLGWPDADIWLASDFPTAWEQAARGPDLAIVDLVMPGAQPLAGIDGVMAAAPNAKLLVVTGTEDDALMLDLLDRGIAGFAPKSASGEIIEAAVRLILAGGRFLPPRLAEIAAARIDQGIIPARRDDVVKLQERLSGRQIDVLKLVARGLSNKEIARELELAPSTVKTHLNHIMACLAAQNRTDASIKARMLELI
jgi:DNA-binding NarL/FixJ family response regulator